MEGENSFIRSSFHPRIVVDRSPRRAPSILRSLHQEWVYFPFHLMLGWLRRALTHEMCWKRRCACSRPSLWRLRRAIRKLRRDQWMMRGRVERDGPRGGAAARRVSKGFWALPAQPSRELGESEWPQPMQKTAQL